jgi:hypothetical protein
MPSHARTHALPTDDHFLPVYRIILTAGNVLGHQFIAYVRTSGVLDAGSRREDRYPSRVVELHGAHGGTEARAVRQ